MAGLPKMITNYIGIVNIDNTEYLTGSTLFGTCNTRADATIKNVTIEDFSTFQPTHGLTIHILFLNSNTASHPKLKIGTDNNAPAYKIYATKGNEAGTTIAESWRAGAVVSLTFIDSRYDDDETTIPENENSQTGSYWLINSAMDTGADPTSTINWSYVTGASDLHAIEDLDKNASTVTGYLKRTGENTWELDNKTFAETADTLVGYGITDAKIDNGTITLGDTTITPLTSHQEIKQDGITGATINRYGVCTESASTAAKTITITSGTMPTLNNNAAGLKITVKFNSPNTANNPTLNGKNIYHHGKQITTDVNKTLLAGVCDFVYDGAQWHLVGNYYDTTYSRGTAKSGGTALSLVNTGDMYIWNNKQNALTFDGTYDASTNKVATESTITNAINALDVDNTNDITGFSNTKTLATLTETDGKIAATFQDIAFPITTVAGVSPEAGTTNIERSSLLTALGLSSAMHYRGGVDDIPPNSGTYSSGDVVTLNGTIKEYVFDGTNWRELGTEGSYKVVQDVVTDPGVSNDETSISFISNITQDAGGVINPTKKNLPIATAGTQGIVSIAAGTNILSITNGVLSHKTTAGYKHIPSGGTTGQFLGYSASGTATWVDNPDTHYTANIYTLGSSGTTVLNTDTNDPYIGLIENSTRNSAVQIKSGTNINVTGNNGVITIDNTYALTAATSDALGGIQIGYSESNSGTNSSRNYAIKLSSNKAYVNVPWTDTKVTQNILATTDTNSYPLLVSAYKTNVNTTTASSVNRVATIYIVPKTGELHASKFYGDGSELTVLSATAVKTALDYNSSSQAVKFLHESGAWKTLKVSATTNDSGSVVTNVSHNGGQLPSLNNTGKAAKFSVGNGVLTIKAGSDATLSAGSFPTVQMSRANLSVSYE